MEARDSFCFPKNTKNPNPSPIGKKFEFCCCGAPPGTRTLGPLINIRTFLRFHGFPESDRFRIFLIIKGNEDLIIIEIDGIDEGIRQRLPLVFQAHVQLAEPHQPSQSNFLMQQQHR